MTASLQLVSRADFAEIRHFMREKNGRQAR
jgi:hypothetical protein